MSQYQYDVDTTATTQNHSCVCSAASHLTEPQLLLQEGEAAGVVTSPEGLWHWQGHIQVLHKQAAHTVTEEDGGQCSVPNNAMSLPNPVRLA